jgi:type VI secretion system protein ImpA
MHGYLDDYWESVHPQLDPDDDNDPTLRVNTVASLCDPASTLRLLKSAPLVDSRALGRFSLLDIAIAKGDHPLPPGMETKPEMAAIDAAFMECDLDSLKATTSAVSSAMDRVHSIEQTLTEKVGASNSVELKRLATELRGASRILEDKLTARNANAGDGGSDLAAAEAPAGNVEQAGTGGGASAGTPLRIAGEIASRDDVIRVLNKVCDYYARFEPSSPVPLLLERAKRLATKSFLEILRDLTPDGVGQAEAIGGIGVGSEGNSESGGASSSSEEEDERPEWMR